METRKAFLLFVDDWLSSASIEAMTPAEEGAYTRLLCRAWQQADCGLPNDDEALARLSRLGQAWFAGSGAKIRQCFFENGSRLFNARLLREREHQQSYRERITGARRKAACQRWQKGQDASAVQLQSKSNACGMHLNHNPNLKFKDSSIEEAKASSHPDRPNPDPGTADPIGEGFQLRPSAPDETQRSGIGTTLVRDLFREYAVATGRSGRYALSRKREDLIRKRLGDCKKLLFPAIAERQSIKLPTPEQETEWLKRCWSYAVAGLLADDWWMGRTELDRYNGYNRDRLRDLECALGKFEHFEKFFWAEFDRQHGRDTA